MSEFHSFSVNPVCAFVGSSPKLRRIVGAGELSAMKIGDGGLKLADEGWAATLRGASVTPCVGQHAESNVNSADELRNSRI